MKTILAILLLIGTLYLSCTPEMKPQSLERIYEETLTNNALLGMWKSIGHGYIFQFTTDSALVHSYTKTFCYKEKNTYLENILLRESHYKLSRDTLEIFLSDYGSDTEYLQVAKHFIRIDNQPNCWSRSKLLDQNERTIWELYKETMVENFAFANRRRINWKSTLISSNIV